MMQPQPILHFWFAELTAKQHFVKLKLFPKKAEFFCHEKIHMTEIMQTAVLCELIGSHLVNNEANQGLRRCE